MQVTAEMLRHVMRRWTTGVAVVTSRFENEQHGMTVNSFTSVSLDPPLVSVTLAVETRTRNLVERSGVFGVTILKEGQADLSDRFAGRLPEDVDRFDGLETFELESGVPLLRDVSQPGLPGGSPLPMQNSVLYVGEVTAVQHISEERTAGVLQPVVSSMGWVGRCGRLTRAEKTSLLELAREALLAPFRGESFPPLDYEALPRR